MTPGRRPLIRCLAFVAIALALYFVMLAQLDRSDLLPRLLSPTREGYLHVALLGLCFFVLRLTLLVVVPGAVLTRVLLAVTRPQRSQSERP